jgi:hypothetical protein
VGTIFKGSLAKVSRQWFSNRSFFQIRGAHAQVIPTGALLARRAKVRDLLQPWNLIFVLPFGCALLLLALTAFGLLPHSSDNDFDTGDIDTPDLGHVGVGEAGFDTPNFEHADIGTPEVHLSNVHIAEGLDHFEPAGGESHHSEVHHTHGPLSLLGFGRVPASLILMCFGFVWGFAGWAANGLLGAAMPPTVFVWPSMLIAFVSAAFLTRTMALTVSRVLPSTESYGVSGNDLIGKRATVRYRITEKSGTAQLYDTHGNLHEVSCRVAPDTDEIAGGKKVILLAYDEREGAFRVRHDPLEDYSPGVSKIDTSTRQSLVGESPDNIVSRDALAQSATTQTRPEVLPKEAE